MPLASTITRLDDYRSSPLPEDPIFFASRLIAEGRHTKVVEYCVLDEHGAVKLMVTVTWNAEPLHPGLWTPTSAAVAAVLLIGQIFDSEVVIMSHDLEDEVLQPLPPGTKGPNVVEMRDMLSRKDLRAQVSDLDDQIALLRYDPARPKSAYGDALLLKIYWDFVQTHLSERSPPGPQAKPPSPTKVSAPPRMPISPAQLGVPAWAWGLGAAIIVQILALGAPWLFPGG